jgi:hypothetical protein
MAGEQSEGRPVRVDPGITAGFGAAVALARARLGRDPGGFNNVLGSMTVHEAVAALAAAVALVHAAFEAGRGGQIDYPDWLTVAALSANDVADGAA